MDEILGSSHARFQFHRLDDWKRQEILKKQQEQQRFRDSLAAQVQEKQRRKQRESTGDTTDEERHRADEQDDRDVRNDHGPEAAALEVRVQSSKFQWEQDAIASKHKKQQEFRKSLEDQVRLKKTLTNLDREDDGEQRQHSSRSVSSTSTNGAGLRDKDRIRQKLMGRSDESDEPVDGMGEGFDRLFQWKRDAIIKKMREQEETRRILQEQIELKRKMKEQEKAQDNEDEEDMFSSSRSSGRRPRPRRNRNAEENFHENITSSNRNPVAQPPPTQQPDEPQHIDTERSFHSTKTCEHDHELQLLKEQVEEQKRLLKEQADIMQKLQRQTEQKQQNEQRESASRRSSTTESKTGTGKGKREKARVSLSRKSKGSTKPTPIVSAYRECTLRRNTAGKLCIEIESVLDDRYCTIKRIGKSFAKDDRDVLQTGDLILALGAFNVRKTVPEMKNMTSDGDLHTILHNFELPTYQQVSKLFGKAGSLVTFAVIEASRDAIFDYAPATEEEQEELDWNEENQHLEHTNPDDENEAVVDHLEVEDPGEPDLSSAKNSELPSARNTELLAAFSPSPGDVNLVGTSKFVTVDEWNTLNFQE